MINITNFNRINEIIIGLIDNYNNNHQGEKLNLVTYRSIVPDQTLLGFIQLIKSLIEKPEQFAINNNLLLTFFRNHVSNMNTIDNSNIDKKIYFMTLVWVLDVYIKIITGIYIDLNKNGKPEANDFNILNDCRYYLEQDIFLLVDLLKISAIGNKELYTWNFKFPKSYLIASEMLNEFIVEKEDDFDDIEEDLEEDTDDGDEWKDDCYKYKPIYVQSSQPIQFRPANIKILLENSNGDIDEVMQNPEKMKKINAKTHTKNIINLYDMLDDLNCFYSVYAVKGKEIITINKIGNKQIKEIKINLLLFKDKSWYIFDSFLHNKINQVNIFDMIMENK